MHDPNVNSDSAYCSDPLSAVVTAMAIPTADMVTTMAMAMAIIIIVIPVTQDLTDTGRLNMSIAETCIEHMDSHLFLCLFSGGYYGYGR